VQVLGKCGELPYRANVSFLGHGHIDLGGSNIDASSIGLNKWQTLLLLGFLFAVAGHRVFSSLVYAPCEQAARMVDKKKMGNLLIGMRLALRQPLTSALPTASGTMLLDGLLSKAPMPSRFIACLHSHGALFYHSPLRIRASFFSLCRG
jgi:hypothetical protein